MNHPAPSQLFLVAAWGMVVAAAECQPAAQAPPIFTSAAAAGDAAPASPPSPAAAPANGSNAGTHVLSPALAATISTALPQYQDPSTAVATPKAKVAQPKNQVPRLPLVSLPQVNVRDKRIRDFTERESYTSKGLQELAVKRYLSDFDRYFLNRFTIPLYGQSQEARAMALYDQDEYINNWRAIYGYDRLPAPNDPPEIPDFSRSPAADPESTAPKNSDWPKAWPRPAP